MIQRICAALALVLLVGVSHAQRFDDVQIESEKVADGLYMLTGAGGNLGVSIGDDGAFIVDSQFDELGAKILAKIEELGSERPRFVVNTHWHGDHTGGNEPMAAAGATVFAHHNVMKRMREGLTRAGGNVTAPSPDAALPLVTYADGVTFHVNGQTIRATHYRHAHTDGDTVLWFEGDNVVHIGDIMFNGIYPFLDHESGGSIQGTLRAVNDVLSRIDGATRIIPGHGPLATRSDLITYRDMLQGVYGAIQAEVAAGKTLEQAIEADPLAEWNEAWGQAFIRPERMVRLVWASVTDPHEA